MSTAIRIENLSKRYQLGLTHAGSVRELANRALGALLGKNKPAADPAAIAEADRVEDGQFWALRDINFTINEGEVLGIIGKNGAGKSTLLKLLSRITYPTTGRVEMHGRVASLLEVGTGFHPELTGRENVFLNGTILGMTRKEVTQQLDAIVDFAGIEKFLDTPVKRYSSGMTVRLGFAVAAHLDPEILIVDEVLAVGDVEFQNRCLGKMQSVAESGKTVLFVSHNLASIRTLTSRTVVLSKGRLLFDGPTAEGVAKYVSENVVRSEHSGSLETMPRAAGSLDRRLEFVELAVGCDDDGCLPSDGTFHLRMKLRATESLEPFRVGMTVFAEDKTAIGSTFSETLDAPTSAGEANYELRSRFRLSPGRYHCAITVFNARSGGRICHDSLDDVLPFDVSLESITERSGRGDWSPSWG
ncbi:MAG: ABC transporter ATP-binding protein, partial [Planctomycetota bacterium]